MAASKHCKDDDSSAIDSTRLDLPGTPDDHAYSGPIGQVLNANATLHVRTQIFNVLNRHSNLALAILGGLVAVAMLLLSNAPLAEHLAEHHGGQPKGQSYPDIEHEMWRRAEPFQDREEYQDQLQRVLTKPLDKDDGLLHALTITGPPGSGKTQLVLDFVFKHKHLYKTQIYIDAETEATLLRSFDTTNSRLHLTSLVDESPAQAVKDHLRSQTRRKDTWIFIMDNANDLSLQLPRYIPKGPRGTVIVISTDRMAHRLLPKSSSNINIDSFEADEGVMLLEKFAIEADDYNSESTIALTKRTVDDLGRMPFAIAVAGARIREDISHSPHPNAAQQALANFRDDFHHHKQSVAQSPSLGGLTIYEKTVWTLWDSTIALFSKTAPQSNASMLLIFISMLDSSTVSRDWFNLASEGLLAIDFHRTHQLPSWLLHMLRVDADWTWVTNDFDEALRPLLRYDLIHTSSSTSSDLRLHSLMAWRLSFERAHAEWGFWYDTFLLCISLGIHNHPMLAISGYSFEPKMHITALLADLSLGSASAALDPTYSLSLHSAGILSIQSSHLKLRTSQIEANMIACGTYAGPDIPVGIPLTMCILGLMSLQQLILYRVLHYFTWSIALHVFRDTCSEALAGLCRKLARADTIIVDGEDVDLVHEIEKVLQYVANANLERKWRGTSKGLSLLSRNCLGMALLWAAKRQYQDAEDAIIAHLDRYPRSGRATFEDIREGIALLRQWHDSAVGSTPQESDPRMYHMEAFLLRTLWIYGEMAFSDQTSSMWTREPDQVASTIASISRYMGRLLEVGPFDESRLALSSWQLIARLTAASMSIVAAMLEEKLRSNNGRELACELRIAASELSAQAAALFSRWKSCCFEATSVFNPRSDDFGLYTIVSMPHKAPIFPPNICLPGQLIEEPPIGRVVLYAPSKVPYTKNETAWCMLDSVWL